jgi:starch synthase
MSMRVLFATAELAPFARVGGLGEASYGLVRALRALGLEVDVVLPDYGGLPLAEERSEALAVPSEMRPARARRGVAAGFGELTLVSAPGVARPHPYDDPTTGEGWPDNTARFFAFSAAVAALAERRAPDLLHINDWHTAPVLGMLPAPPPTLLTIHTLAYQGRTGSEWLTALPYGAQAFAWGDGCNPLAGAIRLADGVATVSPTYAREVVQPPHGFGLDALLAALGDRLVGIRNGIDVATWSPEADPHLVRCFDADHLRRKRDCREDLLDEVSWSGKGPVIGMVTRLTEQKGIDIALQAARYLEGIGARLVMLGAGDPALAAEAGALAAAQPDSVRFREGYDDALSHRIFGGADLFLMPSRFEPCGLAQMQALAYGATPVVTDVGGLHDTVVDDDRERGRGTGFVARTVDTAGVVDALHRAVRAYRTKDRRRALQRRGMRIDWSWDGPAREYVALYERLVADAPART